MTMIVDLVMVEKINNNTTKQQHQMLYLHDHKAITVLQKLLV